jgi:hypothetical protein
MVEDSVPGLAIKIEVRVLRQVDWGGLVGGGLHDELQSVVVRQGVGCCDVQVAREALPSTVRSV